MNLFCEILIDNFLIFKVCLIKYINSFKSFFVPEIVPLIPSLANNIVPKINLFFEALTSFIFIVLVPVISLNL